MLGASITAAHPDGPTSSDRGDVVTSCGTMLLTIGEQALNQMRMPCRTSLIPSNSAATARSQHTGIVSLLKLDGSVDTIVDAVDSRIWLTLHLSNEALVDRLLLGR